MNNLWQWLILLAALIFAIYTLFIVKNEVKTFQEESQPLRIGEVELQIANWWTAKTKSSHLHLFERTDTRYDWYAKLEYIECQKFEKIEIIFEKYLSTLQIAFDPDVVVTTEPSHLFIDTNSREQIIECLRVEGKATQDQMNRIYLDLYVFRVRNNQNYYVFESLSSVLNGMLEGPFFEEAVSRLKVF